MCHASGYGRMLCAMHRVHFNEPVTGAQVERHPAKGSGLMVGETGVRTPGSAWATLQTSGARTGCRKEARSL